MAADRALVAFLAGMLDVLGVSRSAAHRHVLVSARDELLGLLKAHVPRRDDGRREALKAEAEPQLEEARQVGRVAGVTGLGWEGRGS